MVYKNTSTCLKDRGTAVMKLIPKNSSFKNIGKEFNTYVNSIFPDAKITKKLRLAFDVFISYLVHGSWIDNYFKYGFYSTKYAKKLPWYARRQGS